MSIAWGTRHERHRAIMEPILNRLDQSGVPFVAMEFEYNTPSIYTDSRGAWTNPENKGYTKAHKTRSAFENHLISAFNSTDDMRRAHFTYNALAETYWKKLHMEHLQKQRVSKQKERSALKARREAEQREQ